MIFLSQCKINNLIEWNGNLWNKWWLTIMFDGLFFTPHRYSRRALIYPITQQTDWKNVWVAFSVWFQWMVCVCLLHRHHLLQDQGHFYRPPASCIGHTLEEGNGERRPYFSFLVLVPKGHYRHFQNYAATRIKIHGMKVAMDCRQSNKNFTWIRLISIQSLLKLICYNWLIWGQFCWVKHSKGWDRVWLTAVHCNIPAVQYSHRENCLWMAA